MVRELYLGAWSPYRIMTTGFLNKFLSLTKHCFQVLVLFVFFIAVVVAVVAVCVCVYFNWPKRTSLGISNGFFKNILATLNAILKTIQIKRFIRKLIFTLSKSNLCVECFIELNIFRWVHNVWQIWNKHDLVSCVTVLYFHVTRWYILFYSLGIPCSFNAISKYCSFQNNYVLVYLYLKEQLFYLWCSWYHVY